MMERVYGRVRYLGRKGELIKEFEKEYQRDMEDIAWQEYEEGTF